MAATPSKPAAVPATSDTDKHINDSMLSKESKVDGAAVVSETKVTTTLKAPPQSNVAVAEPTYHGSEASSFYQAAKTLLNNGDFETALTTLEEAMETTRSQLTTVLDESQLERLDFHESLAPFHYLYGTTLLYSIEESTDDQQPMTNDFNDTEPETDGPVNTPTIEDTPDDDEKGEEEEEEPIDDMQNAWDHLDVARIILERMLDESKDQVEKLRQDLAQVLLRQGDSQRHSGILEDAVNSYTCSLKHRMNGGETHNRYTRKVADVQCNLGAAYFHLVVQSNEPNEDDTAATLAERSEKRDLYRRQGYHFYYECAKTLGGIVAELAGTADVTQFLRSAEALPQFKTTGEDEDSHATGGEFHPKLICLQLRQLLGMVRELPVPETAKDQAFACIDILEDVLEIVEEADSAEKGVAEATAMKDEIKALAQAQPDNEDSTTVGFGSSAAAEFTELAAQPVTMLVTKKKKRDPATNVDIDGEDAKLPENESATKRTKTSE